MRQSVWFMAVVAVVVVMGSGSFVFADNDTDPVASATPNPVKRQTMCPVMGNEINKKLFVDYEGKRIYVCCGMCIKTVKKDPAKYVKQLEAEGITLDKALPPKAEDAPAPHIE